MRPTDGILALDLATVTGFAYGDLPDSLPTPLEVAGGVRIPTVTHGTFRSGDSKTEDKIFFKTFFNWLDDHITFFNPRLIIFEAPIHTGGRTSFQTARRLMGLATLVDTLCGLRDVPIAKEADIATIKKHFTGSGRAKKPDMIRQCHALGWQPNDDNAADAIALWHFATTNVIEKGWRLA